MNSKCMPMDAVHGAATARSVNEQVEVMTMVVSLRSVEIKVKRRQEGATGLAADEMEAIVAAYKDFCVWGPLRNVLFDLVSDSGSAARVIVVRKGDVGRPGLDRHPKP